MRSSATATRRKPASAPGWDKAYTTIVDSNLTTLIAAIVLFMYGTGPIKGFAVTLSIGIATSMFTAITVTRALVNFVYGSRTDLKTLSIGGRKLANRESAGDDLTAQATPAENGASSFDRAA